MSLTTLHARLRALALWARIDLRSVGLVAVLAVLWVVLDVASDGLFLTPRNLNNLFVQTSVTALLASGMVLVLVARHVDLSVGSVLGFAGMLAAWVQAEWIGVDSRWATLAALACAVGAGLVIGIWQGWWVAYRGVPAFVVTLGGLLIFRGAAFLVTDGRTVAPLAPPFLKLGGGVDGSLGPAGSRVFGMLAALAVLFVAARARRRRSAHGIEQPPFWLAAGLAVAVAGALVVAIEVAIADLDPRTGQGRGVAIPVFVVGSVALALSVLAGRTRFGRAVYALGGSPRAARRAGLPVARVTLGVFALSGALAGLAGAIATARLAAGTNSLGTLAELSAIAAAVVGGTQLSGGVGRISGALLGSLLMQSLENGLVLLNVSSPGRQIAIGLALIAAVFADRSSRGRERA